MTSNAKGVGPLSGLSVVEFAGLGPGPFCGMLLADFGATIVRVDRDPQDAPAAGPVLGRGRRSIVLDLKRNAHREVALQLVRRSDVLLEGYRPGVMERLGLGPGECHAANPSLIYTRLTGWGQSGEASAKAGHDINYIAGAGVLAGIGGDKPAIPLNLIGDYAGGALLAAFGILAAVRAVERGERNLVVDSSMQSGAAYLLSYQFEQLAMGEWIDARNRNALDGAAPYYDCYRCRDGQWLAVGAIEDKFYAQLLAGLELERLSGIDRLDPASRDTLRGEFTRRFAQLPRQAWLDRFSHLDACVSPVLTMTEVARDRQLTRQRVAGIAEPRPTPTLSMPWADVPPAPRPGADTAAILDELGVTVGMDAERHQADASWNH